MGEMIEKNLASIRHLSRDHGWFSHLLSLFTSTGVYAPGATAPQTCTTESNGRAGSRLFGEVGSHCNSRRLHSCWTKVPIVTCTAPDNGGYRVPRTQPMAVFR